mmetsp:Transcript_16290/g.23661  ORF Transcript_16290/g.23661 Transcript_16290/m.23661 type:complete len:103 (+) Transcript_16290:601-909(+)
MQRCEYPSLLHPNFPPDHHPNFDDFMDVIPNSRHRFEVFRNKLDLLVDFKSSSSMCYFYTSSQNIGRIQSQWTLCWTVDPVCKLFHLPHYFDNLAQDLGITL